MSLENLFGIGKKTAQQLNQLNIFTKKQLINTFPKSYENYSLIDFNKANHNQVITIIGVIDKISIIRRNLFIMKLLIKIDRFQTEAIIFNQPFLEKAFKRGDTVLIKGKYNLYQNEVNVIKISKNLKMPEITPSYNLENITDYTIRQVMKNLFQTQFQINETLPTWVLNKYQLLPRYHMIKNLHLPTDNDILEDALRRLKYEEAIMLQLKLQKSSSRHVLKKPLHYNLNIVKDFITKLSFELTSDQKEAVNDIYRDFKKNIKTKRLIQGDVGSGKTIVAIIASLGAITSNKQVVLMAPTEILARQHYETIKTLLSNYSVQLLTSQTSQKEQVKKSLNKGEIDFLIGTHAVAVEDVEFKDLGLVIIDEQHKFGVETRENLVDKSQTADLIYLTATPIPRTLGVAMFADVSITSIKSKPIMQKTVSTKYLTNDKLELALKMVDLAIANNKHSFVVVPAIKSHLKDANIINYAPILKNRYQDKLFILHGELSASEKDIVINNFIKSDGGVLLSTTMVEVGVDIKTAVVMIVLAAENFGLSQLHQLRGRVGRGHDKGYFYLISSKEDVERLKLLETINDGFKLSELDLKLRGPGDFLGVKQSGIFEAKYLDFALDYQILVDAKQIATAIIKDENRLTKSDYCYINKVIEEI